MKLLKALILTSLFYFLFPGCAFADDPDLDPFYTKGVPLDQGPLMHDVFEEVDPFSGNLKIVQTDLELPQNGGLELKLMRTYDSAIWSRRDTSFPGIVAYNEKSPVGIGWKMHMGIVKNPFGTGSENRYLLNNPVLEMPDGSQRVFYKDKSGTGAFVSTDFWTYKVKSSTTWEVTSPDGTAYTAEYSANAGYTTRDLVKVAQITKIENSARTASIQVSYYQPNSSFSFIDQIVDSIGRIIDFNYNVTLEQLQSISFDGKTYYYSYDVNYNRNYLKGVQPPVGNSWQYTYENLNGTLGQLKTMTYPTGGVVTYSYNDLSFDTGVENVFFRVVTQKSISGRDIPSGTWTYQYNSGGASGDVTTVLGPNGMKEVYKNYGWGNCGSGYVWRLGLPISKEIYQNSSLILTVSYTWTKGSTSISYDDVTNADWNGAGGWVFDDQIYVPLLSTKNITRDGKTYTTTYSNYDAYGNPKSIAETGDKTRTTSLNYWYNTAKNIVKEKPASDTVTGGFPGTITTSYSHDTNGNVTQINRYGVVTTYSYYSNGNLWKITDANTKTWTYGWNRGRISSISNPVYAISRVINWNGTIASETNGRGYTTSYLYDGNYRLTRVTPPLGNAVNFAYPLDGSYRKETRGSYYVYHYYDGFGRPTGTLDSKGVTTDIDYKAYGTKNFIDSNIGDKVVFDIFERVDLITHKDNTTIDYSYSGSNETVTDEANKTTTYTYNAFGNPNEKLLVSVKDPYYNTASYGYNILGSLTSVSFGGVSRTFGYSSKNFLTSEYNPETGTITYGRDNVGNLTSKSDATGTQYFYYDSINRMYQTNKGGATITYGYDNADNRTSSVSPSATINYSYDSANRLTQKTETISGAGYYIIKYGYDANHNLTSVTYPGNRIVSYQYNGNNEVTSVPGYVTSASYNLAGQPLSYTYSNGVTNTFTYNMRYLPTGVTAGSVLNLSYGHDSRGNTTSITNGLNSSKNQTLTYDSLSRLAGFNGAWGSGSFSYDATGNRQTKVVGGVNTSYAYTGNRLTSTTGGESGSFSYNGTGLLTSGTWGGKSFSLTYDNFNNVKTFASGASILADLGYDGDGMRVTKAAGGRTVIYHYGLDGNVLSENYENGKLIADYVYLNGKLLAKIDSNVDYDGDGYADKVDAFPLNPNEWLDIDGDGIGNNADTDDDNDGVLDVNDAFPLNPAEWLDTDGDGIGNNADMDDDGDGMPDTWETTYGLNPLVAGDAAVDGDTDGLTNLQEYQKGTNPTVSDSDGDTYVDGNDAFPLNSAEWLDTDGDGVGNNADLDDDGDGMPDTWETNYGLNSLAASDAAVDGDADGLANLQEYQKGTSPTAPDTDGDTYLDGNDALPLNPSEWLDTDGDGFGNNFDSDDDGDGMPDAWETTYGLNPLVAGDAGADGDTDGLTSLQEYQKGTNPAVADTDGDTYIDGNDVFPLDSTEWVDNDSDGIGNNADPDDDNDGMPDNWEVAYGLDPLSSADASQDPDGDGWSNILEYQQGSSPLFKDADMDGMQDDWEILYGLNPSDAADAGLDADGDGLTNLQEYNFGTKPDTIDSDGDGTSDYNEWIAAILVPIINSLLF